MSRGYVDPAMRAYNRAVIPTMIVYVALIFAVPFIIYALSPDGVLLWLIAALPAVPLCAVFLMIGRLLTDLRDEYARALEVRKALIATGVALIFATIWGFLEVYAHAPHLPLYWVPIVWFAGLGLGSAANAVIARRDA